MQWQIEPMGSWPYPETKGRKANPFRAKFDATLSLLKVELEHLKVQGAVAVRVVAAEADVRRDGMLRARAQVRHPGVAISFTSATHGALTYPADAFQAHYIGESWQVKAYQQQQAINEAIKSGKVQVIPIPQGSPVIVSPGK